MAWQRWWPSEHRSSSPNNGVDTLIEVHEATPGFAARYGLRGCTLPLGALVRELGVSGYPSHLPRATRARCPLPGPDFHRRVPAYTRHAVRYHLRYHLLGARTQGARLVRLGGREEIGVGGVTLCHHNSASRTAV